MEGISRLYRFFFQEDEKKLQIDEKSIENY
jgi:hypothetical protein